MTGRRISRWLRRWRADERGVAAVEFAMVVPFLLMAYLIGFEMSNATGLYRKVTDTTSELANVTAQYTTMSCTDFSNVLNATSQIMTPYPSSSLTLIVSEVDTDAGGAVLPSSWSKQLVSGVVTNAPAPTATPPAGFGGPSSSYIVVQGSYPYVPTIGAGLVSGVTMSNQIYMLPRQSTSISSTCP
jgi:Flp pilus assembly protein TadG